MVLFDFRIICKYSVLREVREVKVKLLKVWAVMAPASNFL